MPIAPVNSSQSIADDPQFRERFPWIPQARLGADESLWLRREETGGDDYTWIVLAPGGSPRGQVTLPRRDVVRWFSVNEVWAALPDEYDVQWLVRYIVTDSSSESEQ